MHTFDPSGFGHSSHEKRAHSEFSDAQVWVAEPAAAQIVRIPRALLVKLADGGEIEFRMNGRVREFSIGACNTLRDRLLEHSQQTPAARRDWFDTPR